MRKLITLALKEVLVTFRDVGAIVTMLITPIVLTLAIAAAFGVGGTTTLSDIPVLLLNLDDGPFSQSVIEVFHSESAAVLLDLEMVTDQTLARERVGADEVAALVIIPADFSQRILPLNNLAREELGLDLVAMTQADYESLSPEQLETLEKLYMITQEDAQDPAVVEIYASPTRQISTAVIRGVTTQALEQINMRLAGTNAIMTRLVEAQLAQEEGLSDYFPGMMDMDGTNATTLPITLEITSPTGRAFSWLDYSATSMAVLFLMFAVTSGGRTLLAEKQMGTLPRLLISPSRPFTILFGKMAGIVMTGLLQVVVLWAATGLIGAYWGAPGGVIAAIIMLVLSATGVGALISAWAKTPGQAGAIGSAVTLIAAALSGSFFPRMNLPGFIRSISLVTPNAWGIEIFASLQSGRSLVDILPLLGGLTLLTGGYYLVALLGFRRQFNG